MTRTNKLASTSSLLLAAMGLTIGGVVPANAQTVTTETIDFESPDRDATNIAREMYGQRNPWVAGKRFWLITPEEGLNDQIAVQLGDTNECAGDCEVAILYHTENGWAEIWREEGTDFGLGPVDEITGLKSVIHSNRAYDWDGENYYPMPIGDVPEYREADEAEMQLVVDWMGENMNLPDTAEPPMISVVDMDLKSGDEKAMLLEGASVCSFDECPVLIVDGSEVLTKVDSLGPDVRQGTGLRDTEGYRMVEVMRAMSIDVVSPGTGEVAFDLVAEPVRRAGSE